MQSLVRLGHHDGLNTCPHCGSIGVKCLSQGHNDTFLSTGNEPEATTLQLPTRVTLTLVWMTALIVFPKETTTHCAQYGHRTKNLAITIWRSN